MRHNNYRRTKGEQQDYKLPEQYDDRELWCANCVSSDLKKAEEYAAGQYPVIVFCNDCGEMQYFKISAWVAYKNRQNND